jgi:hypothetical protein
VVAAPPLEHDMKSIIRNTIAFLSLVPLLANAELHVVVVEGIGGNETYSEQFAGQVEAIVAASSTMTSENRIQVFSGDAVSRDAILAHFADLGEATDAADQVAVYLVGHGSFDDFQYKFNIAGPDLTDTDLQQALDSLSSKNQLLVNTSSASGAIAENLANDNRLLVMATRSGGERHATRFGNYFVAALNDSAADLNKNQIVSVAEAFAFAERQVIDYFERNDSLATEHARMEGSRGDRFGIARLTVRRQVRGDDELQELLATRESLNAEIDELRLSRDAMAPDEYQTALLQKMLELATTEDDIENRETELGLRESGNEP